MMQNRPLVSIVIANYNGGEFLEQAIVSVLNQTCQDFELILVDGASTDDSVAIINRYSNRIAWWCSEKDQGQSDAFNKGFSHAKGIYGCWLNADDIMMPNTIKTIKDFLISNPQIEWFCGGSIFCEPDMRVKWCAKNIPNMPFITRRLSGINVNGPSSFFKISHLHHVGGFDTHLHYVMDVDLWLRFSKAGIKLYYLQKYFWAFRIHAKSKTSHRFIENKQTLDFFNESQMILKKRGLTTLQLKTEYWVFKFIKILTGAYFLSWLDTQRYKGVPISTFAVKYQ